MTMSLLAALHMSYTVSRRDAGRRQGFHLDAGGGAGARHGLDEHAIADESRVDFDNIEGQRMAQGDEVRGLLGALNAGQACGFEHVALGQRSRAP